MSGPRKKTRFSLRFLLLIVSFVAVLLALLVRPAIRHQRALKFVEKHASARDFISLVEHHGAHDADLKLLYWSMVLKLFGEDAVLSPRDVTITDPDIPARDLDVLSALTAMQSLSVEHTHADDKFVSKLRNLRNLKFLNLSNTEITDRALAYLGHSKGRSRSRLTHLMAWKTNTTEKAIRKLSYRNFNPISSLKRIYQRSDRVSADDAEAIRDCVRHTNMQVECRNEFVEVTPNRDAAEFDLSPLARIQSDVELSFVEHTVESSSFVREQLEQLSQVKAIQIHGCNVENLEWFEWLPNLKKLVVMRSTVGEGFPKLDGVKSLFVHNTPFTDRDLEQIPAGSDIEVLVIDGKDTNVTDKSSNRIASFRQLQNLGLRNCISLSNEGLGKLRVLPSLSILQLHSPLITSLKPIEPLTQLESVDVTGTNIDERSLEVAVNWSKLKSLNVSGTKVPARSLQGITKRLEPLTSVGFANQSHDPRSETFEEFLDSFD